MTKHAGLNMSFSGLKTHTLTTVRQCEGQGELSDKDGADIACAFELAVVETLVIKCRRALKQEGLRRLVMAGGVGASRHYVPAGATAEQHGCSVFYPEFRLCTDIGAMIAYAGAMRLVRED